MLFNRFYLPHRIQDNIHFTDKLIEWRRNTMSEQIRILFVDDERNVLRSLERTFLDEDYEILTASSGAEGLSVLKSVSQVQVVISDYRMPEMTGVEFLREVCKGWPDTVRIVLSGYADTASIVS